jgi:DNA-binding NarL/FixJ family response regulator
LTDNLFRTPQKTSPTPQDEPLTTREREILKLIAEGASNRAIAELLSISVRTVENHRARLMGKLNIKNSTDLVKYAIRKGYTSTASKA